MTFVQIDPSGILPELSVEFDVTNQPTNPTRAWTSMTRLTRRLQFTRSGRNDEFQRTSTGSLTALVNNRGDAFTGLGVKKAQWIRAQAQYQGITYPLWQGIIENPARQWPQAGHDAIVQLQAADVLKILRLFPLIGQTFPSQRCDQRIVALATLAGLSTGSIDTDTDTADAVSTPITSGDALTTALDTEFSENGLLIADPEGTISFQGRHWRIVNSATPKGTFNDNGPGIPYRDDATYEDDDSRIANYVSVTPYGAADPVTAQNTASQGDYFTRQNPSVDRALVSSDTSLATDCANYLVNKYGDPTPRLPKITVDLAAAAKANPAYVATLLAAGNSDRYTWKRNAATPIDVDAYVEQIAHVITVDPLSWQIVFQLSPAAVELAWQLGDAVNGLLGDTTVLTY